MSRSRSRVRPTKPVRKAVTPRLRSVARIMARGGLLVAAITSATLLACYSGDEGSSTAGTRTPTAAYVPADAPSQNPIPPGAGPPPPGPDDTNPPPPPPSDGGSPPTDSGGGQPPQDSGGGG